jgi:ubiquitin carboxyl-terminal hydrolase 36/42
MLYKSHALLDTHRTCSIEQGPHILTLPCRFSKLDPKLAETTWVHKIFGGRLRSRVTCHSCGYNSDTFDRILDLSLDILRSDSLKNALRKFVAIDYLKGADKYKCEK